MSFTAKAGRDAWRTIAGFVLQVDVTILRWLNLQEGETLELECGEDVDTIQEQLSTAQIHESRLMEQIKRRSGTLTLRAPEALQALVNFCETRQANPRSRLSFRFLTTTTAGIEQGWKREMNGIATWEAIRRGDFLENDRLPALQAIRSVLQTSTKPPGVKGAGWKYLQRLISDDEQLANFITNFQWSIAAQDYLAIEEQIKTGLLQSGHASDNESAERLFERLFLTVFKRLRVSGQKRLTLDDLRHEVTQGLPSNTDRELVGFIRAGLAELEQRVRQVEEDLARSKVTIETLSATVTGIAARQELHADITFAEREVLLDIPDLVSPVIPRIEFVNRIMVSIARTSTFSIVGEPGAGKTQLCLLVARTLTKPVKWLDIPRHYSIQQACGALDAMIASITESRRLPVLRPWYDEATRVLGESLLVVDNIPRTVQGDPLARRIELLGPLLAKQRGTLLLISYYSLPRSTVELLKMGEIVAPRLTDAEITELLVLHGAPSVLASQMTTLVSSATQGLPVLVSAAARFFAGHCWKLSWQQFESVLKAEFAMNVRRDARDLIELTVPDSQSRELLYRLTLAIGGFSRDVVTRIARVPRPIHLPNEKLEKVLGLWVQPFVGDKFTLSPLIDPGVSGNLDENTRKGVHATLAMSTISRGPLEPLDVIACLFHFNSAGLANQAALLLIQALIALTEREGTIEDEWGISNFWTSAPLSEDVDINLRLYVRSLQVVALDLRGRDFSSLLAELEVLVQSAGNDAWGTAIASSLIAIRFYRKHPAIANAYLLVALRALKIATLPDGTHITESSLPLEGLFWATAVAASSDSDVESWIASVGQLNPNQISMLAESDLAELSTVMTDGVWHREYLAKGSAGDWDRVERLVQRLEDLGKSGGLRVLEAAAIRTKIMIRAEWRRDIVGALELAASALQSFDDDEDRFLITEVTGRQLSYSGRSSEAIEWLEKAHSFPVVIHALWRRNVLITLAQEVGKTNASLSPTFTSEALEIAQTIAPLFRTIEALAEHSIAWWNAGNRTQAFEAMERAVRALIPIEDDDPEWKTLLLALFQVVIYFSSVAYFGHPPSVEGFIAPLQGMFLGSGSIDVTKFNPAQKSFIRMRMAMFAEGLGLTTAAGFWADEALQLAAQIPEARTIYPLSYLSIAPALLRDDYTKTIRLARMMAEGDAPSPATLARIALDDPNQQQQLQEFFSHPATTPMAMLLSAVPIAFRLATLKIQGTSERDICRAIDDVSGELSGSPHQDVIVTALQRSLVGDTALSELRRLGNELIPRLHDTAAGMIYRIGSATRSPLAQALHDQVWLLQNGEKMFAPMPSIRRELIYPFFVVFWTYAASVEIFQFRTSEAYTRRCIEIAAERPSVERIKELLKSMSFCLGLAVPDDIRD